ncbi:MAG TPA: DUF3105 domain-containing protein [candidate division Zixibacteria bacterium]|nr:DUF3105 domain-containing protein [candidate division Zixibacteria bacterium]
MAKRRTSGIQRRRASEAALSRPLEGRSAAIDPRILIVGGVLVVGAIILVVVILFGGRAAAPIGTRMAPEGADHVPVGQMPTYQSRPATSGPHWNALGQGPIDWGVYTSPVAEPAVVHNLEHGGIVIWYQPGQTSAQDVQALTQFVEQQIRSSRFKVILSPWGGEDFGAPIAVTAWEWMLKLETADLDQIRAFIDQHYQQAPENQGGPGQPVG